MLFFLFSLDDTIVALLRLYFIKQQFVDYLAFKYESTHFKFQYYFRLYIKYIILQFNVILQSMATFHKHHQTWNRPSGVSSLLFQFAVKPLLNRDNHRSFAIFLNPNMSRNLFIALSVALCFAAVSGIFFSIRVFTKYLLFMGKI